MLGVLALAFGMAVRTFAFSTSTTVLTQLLQIQPMIIRGTAVPKDAWQQVVYLKTVLPHGGTGECSAFVVGPRTLLTVAHCGSDGLAASFSHRGKTYSGVVYQSPSFAALEHDLAVVVTTQPITDVEPVTVLGEGIIGDELTILGYGCTSLSAATSGHLNLGKSVLFGREEVFLVSKMSGGAATCPGDSGGPALMEFGGKLRAVGVNSKGDLESINFHVDLQHAESQKFLRSVVQDHGVSICGVDGLDCDGEPPPTQTEALKCSLTAIPAHADPGTPVTLTLTTRNSVSLASINGREVSVPSGEIKETRTRRGVYRTTGYVKEGFEQAFCFADYTIGF